MGRVTHFDDPPRGSGSEQRHVERKFHDLLCKMEAL